MFSIVVSFTVNVFLCCIKLCIFPSSSLLFMFKSFVVLYLFTVWSLCVYEFFFPPWLLLLCFCKRGGERENNNVINNTFPLKTTLQFSNQSIMCSYPFFTFISFQIGRWIDWPIKKQQLKMNLADSTMSSSASEELSCGGAVAGSIFGTIACIIVLTIGAWFLYKKYWKNKSGKRKWCVNTF